MIIVLNSFTIDLPVIISEDFCGFLEPQEDIWKGESGKGFRLNYLSRVCPDSLIPYHNICGFSKDSPLFKNKTIFRFPLRKHPSNISKGTFDKATMMQLIRILKTEAKYLLLFLRSIHSIEVIELSSSGEKCMFKVAISPRDTAIHSYQQQSLVHQVEASFTHALLKKVIQETFHFNVQIEDDHEINTHEWLVVHRVGSEDDETLALANRQHVLPWVGTAYEITQSCDNSGGRIFCILPLPTEDRLPFSVHVNGTFAISSNRRSLNWESEERFNDQEATWNKLLVEKCISQCYVELIAKLLKIPSIGKKQIYECWPIVSKLNHTPWEGILVPLFKELFRLNNVVYTCACDGQWISLNDGIFIDDDEKVLSIIKKALINANEKIVEIPSQHFSTIKSYRDSLTLKILIPAFAKSIFKSHPSCYQNFATKEKLCLLKYCLSDETYSDLPGLKLVPLRNGFFGTYESRYTRESTMFVCSNKIRHDLLPGLDHLLIDLLDTDLSLHGMLYEVAKSGDTQLTVLNASKVAKLIPQSNPKTWSLQQLKKFWKWLENYDLKMFSGLYIVPVKNSSIQKLEKQFNLVHVSQYHYLNQTLRNALQKFNLCFSSELDFPFLRHSQLKDHLYQFERGDVLDAIPLYSINNVSLSDAEALTIQQFFNSVEMTESRIQKLCNMALFSVIQENHCRCSISYLKIHTKATKALLKGEGFYFKTDLLSNMPLIFDVDHYQLLSKLSDHVHVINGMEFLISVVFPFIKNGYFQEHLLEFMISVLNNLHTLFQQYPHHRVSLKSNISKLPFVSIQSGSLKHLSSLFDPNDEIVTDLYCGEPVFPSGKFVDLIGELRLCGLKDSKSLTAIDLYNIVHNICNQLNHTSRSETPVQCNNVVYTRVIGVFSFLNENSSFFKEKLCVVHLANNRNTSLEQAIASCISTCAFLPIATDRPTMYPHCLNWKGSNNHQSLIRYTSGNVLFLPLKLDHCVVGLVVPPPEIIGSQVFFIKNIPPEISNYFRSSNNDLVDAVVKHYKHVLENHENIESEMLEQISLETYKFLNSCDCYFVDLSSLPNEWIWVDASSKFVDPATCAMKNNSMFTSSLEPFIYVLPKKMKTYENFLCKFGVQKSITSEQIISVLHSLDKTNISANIAWSFVKNILEWVIESNNVSGDILVPVNHLENPFPQLHPAYEVSYVDLEMFLELSQDGECKLVHPNVAHLAAALELPLLSDQLDITEDVFQDAGQQESLITRLTNILEEYKDGLTIIKEMIQNADDAESTEVNILYDSRQHTTERLLFKGIGSSHGPAIVVHNNAKFTEEDFVNITKLAGATKKDKPLKIGKFGVGFCSVYHITDVPSFVTGDWLYIFDPTLSHLKGVVKNENQPGKKVKYMSKFITNTQQLEPYKALFGFNPSKSYDGTMFRLPFRIIPSQISRTRYNEDLVKKLKADLMKNGDSLLLFLNSVKKITFQSIKNGEVIPTVDMTFTKTKNIHGITEVTISCKGEVTDHQYWVISDHKEKIYNNHRYETGMSSVACQLKLDKARGNYEVTPIDGCLFCFLPLQVPSIGLPVHVHSNFAVMNNRSGIWIRNVNEEFNTDALWNDQLVKAVIPKAYCELLLKLKVLHCNKKLHSLQFYSVWPLPSTLKATIPWADVLKPVYQEILNHSLFYSDLFCEWKYFNDGKVFEKKMLTSTPLKFETVDKCILEAANVLQLSIFRLPNEYVEEIRKTEKTIPIMTLNQLFKIFFEKINNFQSNKDIRNNVLFYAFQELSNEIEEVNYCGDEECDYTTELNDSILEDLLRQNMCVPCTPNGLTLKHCVEIIDPNHIISKLFVPEDSCFPVSKFCQTNRVYKMMVRLGMQKDTLPWKVLLNCAQKIARRSKQADVFVQVDAIIECIGNNIVKKEFQDTKFNGTIHSLKCTPFLPILKRSDEYLLDWFGDKHILCSPSNVLQVNIKKAPFLVGSQQFIFDVSEGHCKSIPSKVAEFLGIKHSVMVTDVLAQYELLLKHYGSAKKISGTAIEHIEKTCEVIYKYWEVIMQKEKLSRSDSSSSSSAFAELEQHLSSSSNRPFIWSGRQFICPVDVAQDWTKEGPFLFKMPPILSQHHCLIKCLGVETTFSPLKLVNTLKFVFRQFCQLPKYCHPIIIDILESLNKVSTGGDSFEGLEGIILPDNEYRLCPAVDLSFNDTPWIQCSKKNKFVHKNLIRDVALDLGVLSCRTKFLSEYEHREAHSLMSEAADSHSKHFGQNETLARRIKNILRDYPLDMTLLKEFLQNSDDAKATKLFVILDKRNHGSKFTPSDKWKEELQGPALLIWNDKEFSETDLEGIQSLGLGSKRGNPDSIGEFGIGFNVIYHITDCPCLFTKGNVLCVFDPFLQYVPLATEKHPGCRYNTDKRFWNTMKDLVSPLMLSEKLSVGQPHCLKKGSLFRFPLRMKCSDKNKSMAKSITVKEMEDHLDQWMDDIKDSLLFLNHVVSFKMFVVDEKSNEFVTKVNYEVVSDRKSFHKKLEHFKGNVNHEPFVVSYPLSINIQDFKGEAYNEQWLIQQGVGDVGKADQDVGQDLEISNTAGNKIEKMNPDVDTKQLYHSIAAPVVSCKPFSGKIFCFLPLPNNSGLPVHINGRFVLSSSRRSLWQGEKNDKNTRWNDALMMAICSSYVKFIVNARRHFLRQNLTCENIKCMIDKYYSLFPYWLQENDSDPHIKVEKEMVNECKELAKGFFQNLSILNSDVLVSYSKVKDVVEWHPILNKVDPFRQVHFLRNNNFRDVVEMIQMRLTSAPGTLSTHLENAAPGTLSAHLENAAPGTLSTHLENAKCAHLKNLNITPETVFNFYVKFHHQLILEELPCHIHQTVFKSVDRFYDFVKFITRCKEHTNYCEFINSPEQQPLLLTANEYFQKFVLKSKICSKYYHLFPNSQGSFLHPFLLSLNLDPEYFLTSTDITYGNIALLMNENFPALSHYSVDRSVVTDEQLNYIWECFGQECIFEEHKKDILRGWALLPATNSCVYRLSSLIIPVYYRSDNDNQWSELIELLQERDFPFLDPIPLSDLSLATKVCPKLSSDYDKVFSIIYNIHIEKGILSNLSNPEVCALFIYFSHCSFRHNRKLLSQLKSLPLFTTVNRDVTSLCDKRVYLWPENLCTAACKKWIPKHVVFLEECGSWRYLCGKDISVLCTSIDVEDVYCDYIFKQFDELGAVAQREHIEYIRNNVYKCANYNASENKQSAKKFISELQQLKFLQHKNELLPVNRFFMHDTDIFCAFPNHFLLLDEEFRTDKWIDFFKVLGIREKVTFEEYEMLCKEIECGQHEDIVNASTILIDYLFSGKAAESWYKNDEYLERIKKIKFLVADDMSKFCWIREPYKPQKTVPKLNVSLVCFEKAASHDIASLIWTVKPIITLPEYSQPIKENNVIEKLGLTISPTAEEVYANIIEISKSQIAIFELFFNYSFEYNDFGENVIDVMAKNIRKLYEIDTEGEFIEKLQDISCIPVFASTNDKQPVLVNCHQVVMTQLKETDTRIAPYVSILPDQLSIINDCLLKIGVQKALSLTNIQYVLKFCFKRFKNQEAITPQDKKVLGACIEALGTLLQNYDDQEKVVKTLDPALYPLYLPSSNDGCLCPASQLLYLDCDRYKKHHRENPLIIKVENTGRFSSYFQIPSWSTCTNSFTEENICCLLPQAIRPTGLSLICHETPVYIDQGDTTEEGRLYVHFRNLQNLFKENIGIKAKLNVILLVKFIDREDFVEAFAEHLVEVIEKMTIVQVINLKANVSIVNGTTLGCHKQDFVFEKSSKYIMYIDSKASSGTFSKAWKDISHILCVEMSKILEHKLNIHKFLCFCFRELLCSFLQIESMEDLQEFMANEQSAMETLDIDTDIKIGARISEIWKKNYDFKSDTSNIFKSQEPVGYEKEIDGEIVLIWALCLIETEEGKFRFDITDRQNSEDEIISVTKDEIYKIFPKYRDGKSQENNLIPEIPLPVIDLRLARLWLKQAESDYKAMMILFKDTSTEDAVICQALFMAHEVMEKGLKAAMYASIGVSFYLHCHYIDVFAAQLLSQTEIGPQSDRKELVRIANIMKPYYLHTRFPNRHSDLRAPVDFYTPSRYPDDKKTQIVDQIKEALRIMKLIIDSQSNNE